MPTKDTAKLLFGSPAFATVLNYLVARPGEAFSFNSIDDAIEPGPESINLALRRLVGLGLVSRVQSRSSVTYQIKVKHPIYKELKSICTKLFGIGELLQSRMQFGDELVFALVFGSVAAGTDDPESDVDILFLGEPNPIEVAEWEQAARAEIGREVNIITITVPEFVSQVKSGNSFYGGILRGHKTMLKGIEEDLLNVTLDAKIKQ